MLVEEQDRGQVVLCLICKTPIRVGADPGTAPTSDPNRPRPEDRPPHQ
jgi:hypothetical protein